MVSYRCGATLKIWGWTGQANNLYLADMQEDCLVSLSSLDSQLMLHMLV